MPTTLKNNGLEKTIQTLILLISLSLFAPYQVSGAFIACVGATFCILPDIRDKIFCHKGSFIALLFLLVTAVTALCNGNRTGLIRTGVFAMMIVVALVARTIMTRPFFERVMNTIIIGGCLSTAVCIGEQILHRNDPLYRCQAFFTNPNFFGTAAVLVILICAYKAVTHCKFVALYYVAAVFNAVGIYLCKGMVLWLIAFIGIVLLLVLNHEYRLLVILLGLAAAVSIVLVLVPDILSRLNELSATTNNRIKIWTFAIEQIKEAPIFGRGFFSYKFLYNQMSPLRPELYKAALSHNILLDSLLCHGIVGTLLAGGSLARYYKTLLECRSQLKQINRSYTISTFIAAVTIAVFFHGIIDTTVIWVQTGMIILFIYSGLGVDERELKTALHEQRTKQ